MSTTPVVCPMCGRKLRAPNEKVEKVGSRGSCPSCGESFVLKENRFIEPYGEITHIPEKAPLFAEYKADPRVEAFPEIEAEQNLPYRPPAHKVWSVPKVSINPKVLNVFFFTTLGLSCVWSMAAWLLAPPGLFFSSGLLSLIAFTILASILLRNLILRLLRWKVRRVILIVGWMTGTALLSWLYATTGTYQKVWSITSSSYGHKTYTEYTDTIHRGGPRVIYRQMRVFRENNLLLIPENMYEGPMTGTGGTGSPHGHWEHWNWEAPFGEMRSDHFYWYGEIVTEGEWHLRNRSD